ncbi:MAG: MFS transporter [Prevotellaceae bacterium]|jgi:MFS family permease|nr:MFS transporter [Prevotellaceae bacterium]
MKRISMKNAGFSGDFIFVAIGQIISIFGNQILRYALPLYLLNQTGSAALFGTILAISSIPMLLLYPIGGIIADRFNKRNTMVILDFSMTLLISLFCLFEGRIDIVLLVAITMIVLYGIQGAYQPAVQSSIPLLLDAKYVMQGNSIINTITSLSSMAGPIIGGILFSIVGLSPILYVSIGCFFVSAVMEMFIYIPFERRKIQGNMIIVGFNDLKDSFRFMFKESPILWKVSLVYSSVGLLLTSLILIAAPVIIIQHLGFSVDRANRLYGYAQGVIAVGAVLGGVFAGVLSKKLTLRMSPFILIGCALSILLIGVALQILESSMLIYLVLATCCGLLVALSTIFQIQIMSYIQILTPKELIGKVISCVICICMCTMPLGQFIYGFVFENIEDGFYFPFYIASLLIIGISILTRHFFYEMDSLLPNKQQRKCA